MFATLQVPHACAIHDLVKAGLVQITYFSYKRVYGGYKGHFTKTPQGWAYNSCIREAAAAHEWLAFIDVDEFLYITNPGATGLRELLSNYSGYGALAVNWIVMGSSGHRTRPAGGILQHFTACVPRNATINKHVKVIGNTKYISQFTYHPHNVAMKSNASWTVNEQFARVDGPYSEPPSHQHIALFHYAIKSWDDFQKKLMRGGGAGSYRDGAFFQQVDNEATEHCRELACWHNASLCWR